MADRPKVPSADQLPGPAGGRGGRRGVGRHAPEEERVFGRPHTLPPKKGKGEKEGEADVDESELLQMLLHLLSVSVVLSPLTTPSDKKNKKKSKSTETNEQKVRLAVSLLDERDGWDVRNAAIQLGVERGDATVVGYEYSSFVCSSSSAMDLVHQVGMKGKMTESIVVLALNPTSTTICVPTNTQQVSASNSENISTFRSIRHANMRRTNNISLSPNSDADPILRRYAAAVTIDTSDTWKIFVFGGVEDVMVDGDLFSIDLSVPAAPKYKLLTQSIDNIPSPRANHRTVAGLGKMWLFDGVTKGDVLLNDLFLLSTRILLLLRAQRTFVHLRRSRKRRQDETASRDLWVYSLVTRCWTKREGSFARKLNWEAAANSSSVPRMKLDFVSNANSFPLHSKCVSILSKILNFKTKSKSNP
ncbi:hypothetical protein BLNAU_19090 [Blattamonas nauphoetae]|uniref:Uncharacterized protein n=1 Tax=Blattamonas nauphoetae TaxID=2049346 RepID=A0ABQ9X3V5_9EUKA|nr:hypothetical protein BLNAU_19090 [Blattamonas nauphoetae]